MTCEHPIVGMGRDCAAVYCETCGVQLAELCLKCAGYGVPISDDPGTEICTECWGAGGFGDLEYLQMMRVEFKRSKP